MLLQFMKITELCLLIFLVSGASLVLYHRLFLNMLKRSRWLMLTLVLVFSFATPGEYLSVWPEVFAPTYEGVRAGALQLIRLVIMLAGLTLLLGSTSREMLMGGIYTLLRPCSVLGVSAERFTARIWLTLDYVERDPVRNGQHWQMLEKFEEGSALPAMEKVVLSIPGIRRSDVLIGVVLTLSIFWWIV